VEAEEKLLMQRLQDREGQNVMSRHRDLEKTFSPEDDHLPETESPHTPGAITDRAELIVYEEY
jgi:hypothetical protein